MRNSVLLTLALCAIASAQPYGRPPALRNVGIDQRLDSQVPLDLSFKDEAGRDVQLRSYFGKKPVVLALVYYQCPMLCNMVLNGLTHAMKLISLDLGKDYDVVAISFDPREKPQLAADKKASYVERYGREGTKDGWHFLTGNEIEIRKVAQAVGFNYTWDNNIQQWAHAAGIMILTPEGKVSRYFYGVEYLRQDVRLGLVEASHNKIGNAVDRMLLFCYHYDPSKGRYGFAVVNALRAGGSLTVLALGVFMFVMIRRERRGGVRKQSNARTL